MHFHVRMVFFVSLSFLFFSGCQNTEEKNEYIFEYSINAPLSKQAVYIFGVHPLHNSTRLFQVYQPMINYINAHLDGAQLRLESSRDYPSYDKKLFSGHFHFALPNPYQTVTAADHGYTIFGKMGDDENFRGIILVRKDSKIKRVSDLKGKSVSYPAPTALAATMMPQWYLHEHGININKEIKNSYVGSQESSIMNVYLGKSAAAATWPPPWYAFIKERPEIAKEVMIKWETPSLINNGLVARDDVPDEVVQQVAEIIMTLHTHDEGKKILQKMELSRYERADDKTYEPVRMFLKKFETEIRTARAEK